MLKGTNVIGKDVLSRADGEKMSTVKDLVIAADHTRVLALLTEEGSLFSKARMVPMSRVVAFGKDAVVVVDKASEAPAEEDPQVKESLNSKDKLVGKHVYSDQGDQQARVSDIYFDETSANIVGLELSGGVLENSEDGTAYLPVEDIISIGQDAVMIKAGAVTHLLEQASGVRSAASVQEQGQPGPAAQ